MSYSQQDLLQILSILSSSVYVLMALAITLGMDDAWKKTHWSPLGIFYIAANEVEYLKKVVSGSTSMKTTPITWTERQFAKIAVWVGFTSIGLYWGSLGQNLSNGTANGLTNGGNPTTQSWYVVGTIWFALVMISMILSMLYWLPRGLRTGTFINIFPFLPELAEWYSDK